MTEDDLLYASLLKRLAPFVDKGRSESTSFLNWFLMNIYRLDEVEADDAICDNSNDKGIDGIYVDHGSSEIHFFQSKLVQADNKTIGDVDPKNLLGSLKQFESAESVQKILEGNAHPDLKNLLKRNNVVGLVDQGYQVLGVFVCNQLPDQNTEELQQHDDPLIIYSRREIAQNYVDFDADEGAKGEFVFDASYVGLVKQEIEDGVTVFVLPVAALELVRLAGIADGTLFSQNVRLDLGKTAVNKAIAASVSDKSEHKHFPLFHNGVTILCQSALEEGEKLKIANYVVVNGAQSITTFYGASDKITADLRVSRKSSPCGTAISPRRSQ